MEMNHDRSDVNYHHALPQGVLVLTIHCFPLSKEQWGEGRGNRQYSYVAPSGLGIKKYLLRKTR